MSIDDYWNDVFIYRVEFKVLIKDIEKNISKTLVFRSELTEQKVAEIV